MVAEELDVAFDKVTLVMGGHFDATGVRLRTMPFTPEVVRAAMG